MIASHPRRNLPVKEHDPLLSGAYSTIDLRKAIINIDMANEKVYSGRTVPS